MQTFKPNRKYKYVHTYGLKWKCKMFIRVNVYFIYREVGTIVYRILVQDTSGQSETNTLNEVIPDWVREVIVSRKPPKLLKVSFYLQPYQELFSKNSKK